MDPSSAQKGYLFRPAFRHGPSGYVEIMSSYNGARLKASLRAPSSWVFTYKIHPVLRSTNQWMTTPSSFPLVFGDFFRNHAIPFGKKGIPDSKHQPPWFINFQTEARVVNSEEIDLDNMAICLQCSLDPWNISSQNHRDEVVDVV